MMSFFLRPFGSLSLRYGLKGRVINALLLLVTLSVAPAGLNAQETRIVMLGDSITAGYGLPPGDALPLLVQEKLNALGISVTVENAGVSGDTSAGGLARLDWAVQGQPSLVVVALGANDGLRGVDPKDTQQNLRQILQRLKERGIDGVLAGMLAPPNMGADYGDQFNAVYPALAETQGVPLYPFLLDGVAARAELNQADGIHPNAKGTRIVAERLAIFLKPLLTR